MNIRFYSLSLIVPGWIIGVYHNLLYYGVIEKPLVPCHSDVPCNSRAYEFFGFLGIPLMALIAYTIIGVILVMTLRKGKSAA